MNIARLLAQTARVFPNAPAVFRGTHLCKDYRLLARDASALAGALGGLLGLEPGARVALFMENQAEYLEILYAVWWVGLMAVPINAKLHPEEALVILENSGAEVLFASPSNFAKMARVVERLPHLRMIEAGGSEYARLLEQEGTDDPLSRSPTDLAWLFYTSGTTGAPKGVMLTHRNLMAMTLAYFTDVDAVAVQDTKVYAAPFSHGAGLYNFPHVLRGCRHVVPESGGFDADELTALSHTFNDISMFAAPTMVRRLVEHVAKSGDDPSGFKTIVYGGGPMYVADLLRALDVMGNRFVQIYGQGETPMTITALARGHLADRGHPRYLERIASVGVAHSVVEVKVADEDGVPLTDGEAGEVLVRGETVMAGYWRNPAATAQTLRDGWLRTGDIGCLDADGFLTLKDRSKDVIISGGSNIYPREVEEVLLRDPGVAEVSVLGCPHEEWGEIVVACIAQRPGMRVTPEALDALCIDHIARFKRPKEYLFFDSLPKNEYGKISKMALRKLAHSKFAIGAPGK